MKRRNIRYFKRTGKEKPLKKIRIPLTEENIQLEMEKLDWPSVDHIHGNIHEVKLSDGRKLWMDFTNWTWEMELEKIRDERKSGTDNQSTERVQDQGSGGA